MIDVNVEAGGDAEVAPNHSTRCRARTISFSNEESGIDSLSSGSSLPSVSSPSRTCPHGPGSPCPQDAWPNGPSSPESVTSDYRSSPSPNTVNGSTQRRRRSSIAPCSSTSSPKLQNLCVSLPKLSLPPHNSTCQNPSKKMKIENTESKSSSFILPSQTSAECLHNKRAMDTKCNTKILPKSRNLLSNERCSKIRTDSLKDSLSKLNSEDVKSADMKLEMAKIDSILKGKLLLDQASHKLSDMLLLDKLESGFTVKPDASLKNEYINNNNNNNVEESSRKGTKTDKLDNKSGTEYVICKWKDCGLNVEVQNLLDHLTTVHIITQKSKSETEAVKYQCLWTGCKVYSTCSTSYTWLTTHVTKHVGNKPFICIVDGCRQRFGNQVSLSRHVNSHFKNPCGTSQQTKPINTRKNSITTSPIKFYIRKNRRKVRSGVTGGGSGSGSKEVGLGHPDLFHIGIMAGIKDGLSRFNPGLCSTECDQKLEFDSSRSQLVFRTKVKSRKLDENGNVHYLVSWLPAGMFADEWVSKKEMKIHRQVPISQLPSLLKTKVEKQIFGVTSLNSGRKQQKVSGPPKLT